MTLDVVKKRAFQLYGRLPRWLRVFLIRRVSPSFRVGAICVIRRSDGAILLLRNSYRQGWGLPGGLLRRNEEALDAVKREVREEVGIDVEIDGEPRVLVDGRHRRIDVIFSGHLRAARDGALAAPTSPEVREVGWFLPDGLPVLQNESESMLALVGVGGAPVVS